MHINAFVPTERAIMEGDAVNATQVPFLSIHLPPPEGNEVHQLTAPVLLCVWTDNGTDYDPHFYVQARDPEGQVRGNVELMWHWEDAPNAPHKWRVFDLQLPFLVFGGGVYTFGVFADRDDETDQALARYPFSVILDAEAKLPRGSQLPPGAEFR